MVRRRHQNKSIGWLTQKYGTASGKKHWFAIKHKTKHKIKTYTVKKACAIGVKRYVKIKADANPYLPEYAGYFWKRRNNKKSKLLSAMSAREHRALAA